MKTLESRHRVGRLFLFYLISTLLGAFTATFAKAGTPPPAPATRAFWVWNLNVMPPTFRRATATLRAAGDRSLIYVEDKFYGREITAHFVLQLNEQLESKAPSSAFLPGLGIVSLEEQLFGALPRKVSPDDDRLIVLFADLGQFHDTKFDGFFNPYDQLSDQRAIEDYRQRSNEANILYINGFRQTGAYTTGVIAHELHHLLSHHGPDREAWLSETLAEGAMLLTGFFTDQLRVEQYVANPGSVPLVTPSYVQYGPQLLFASFLIDSIPLSRGSALTLLRNIHKGGRDAIEELFLKNTNVPLSFDAIFSNFVSYVFTQSDTNASLPAAWDHRPGLRVPRVASYFTYQVGSGELNGELAPYSFVAIDLAQELSPSAVIQVRRVSPTNATAGDCARNASVLWKPISRTRIAVYAVGCDPSEKSENVQFRLKILD